MKKLAMALAAFCVCAFSSAATAKDIPAQGISIQDVVTWLQGKGYQAQVMTEANGTPYVHSGANGNAFNIMLYDCKDGNCGSLQFYVGLTFSKTPRPTPDAINGWNRDNRWGRSYTDKVGDPWVEMDVDLTPGGTYDLLDDEFAIWILQEAAFIKYTGW
ncbi:MAG TPA: YbjN domain-containing protein [Rhizomicrobium sp.]